MTFPFPPPPKNLDTKSVPYKDWLNKLRDRISNVVTSFLDLDFTGSNITSILTRNHNDLTSIQGGASNDYYHFTSAQHTDLTDGGDSSLHFHSADRSNSFSTISVSGQSDVVADSSTDTLTLVAGTNITLTTNASTDTITITGAAGISDGDKGDISVTGSGATWTIDSNTVSYAKMQDVSSTSRVLGRKTSGSGDPEECTLSEVLDFIGSATQGDILYRGSSSWSRLPVGASGTYLQSQGSGANLQWATSAAGGMVSVSPVATTSGTTVEITGIPAGVKRITVALVGVSTSGSARAVIQLGTSGGYETSGYNASSAYWVSGTSSTATSNGFGLQGPGNATEARYGCITLTLMDASTNLWACNGVTCQGATNSISAHAGTKTLSGTLTKLRLNTSNGTDTFDAGSFNIVYE